MATSRPTPPNLKQLAVLDWLRRWPAVRLRPKGRWTASWHDEAARVHMMGVVAGLGCYPVQGTGGREGWGTFDGTPHCGSATLRVLLARSWVEIDPGASGREAAYRLASTGLETLLRYCFRLKGYSPRLASERVSRPIKASPALLKRYGGPGGARSYAEFHERQAAYHQRIATRLRDSLAAYEDSPERRRDEWAARGKRRHS